MFVANPMVLSKAKDIRKQNEVFEQRKKHMKLLNYTLLKLLEIDEIGTAEQLSIDWCNKNKNWAAWQKHAGQDFSIDAAINCLARTRLRLVERQDKTGQLVLAELEQLLSDYLLRKHNIAEIARAVQEPAML
jgi:hypothetical protein